MIERPFHDGELRAQELAGGGERHAAIRDFMPDQHREFFALLRYIFVSIVDDEGRPHATALTGEVGFVASPDATSLHIAARLDPKDPATQFFKTGARIGLLGLDLSTRRRNRANGVITSIAADRLTIAVRESFGNCPQYIQTRDVRRAESSAAAAIPFETLDGAPSALITNADTLFIATAAPEGGADMSHRGGRPGFVRIDGNVLTIPDFRGNRYFNTLGNLTVEPRAALLVVDFATGDVLQAEGEAEIDWRADSAAEFPGAERLWRFTVTNGWLRPTALPLRWSFRDFSPMTERAGTWASARRSA